MDLSKIYYDAEGNEVNILQLVKKDPEWAANQLQESEKLKQLEQNHKKMLCELSALIKETLSEYNATPDKWDHLYAILEIDI